jgi:hypothetical protein
MSSSLVISILVLLCLFYNIENCQHEGPGHRSYTTTVYYNGYWKDMVLTSGNVFAQQQEAQN